LLKLTGGLVAAPPLLAHVPALAVGTVAEHELEGSSETATPKSSQVAPSVASVAPHVGPHATAEVPQAAPLAVHTHAAHCAGEKMSPSYVSSCVP
jgi:hypothetical protein